MVGGWCLPLRRWVGGSRETTTHPGGFCFVFCFLFFSLYSEVLHNENERSAPSAHVCVRRAHLDRPHAQVTLGHPQHAHARRSNAGHATCWPPSALRGAIS